PHEDVDRLPRPRLERPDPAGLCAAGPLHAAHPAHLPPGRQRHDDPRRLRARGPGGARVRLAPHGGDPPRARGARGRLDPRRPRADARREGVGRRQRPPLRHSRRRQAPRRARLAAPLRPRPRGRVRGHHRAERDDPDPQRGGAAPGATAVCMSPETPLPADTADAKAARAQARRRRRRARSPLRRRARAGQTPADAATPASGTPGTASADGSSGASAGERRPASSKEEGLRARAAALWSKRIHPVLDVVSPIGWAVLAVAAVCWAVGLSLHITELNIIAVVLTVPLLIAALFVLGKANYRVRSEEHTSELQSREKLVCRLLLEQ